jgi:uncharacterized protein
MAERSTTSEAQPVAERERIVALDVLRGFALLGILVMNVQAFAMPSAAYTNPNAYGSLEGIEGAVWIVSDLLADQKFMSIFSMLFGAGICLFADRAASKGARPARLHYRRTLVLLLVGVAHGYLLFYGDILTYYALCALWVYPLRNRSPRTLVIIAAVLFVIPTAVSLLIGSAVPHMPPEARQGMAAGWAPPPAELAAAVEGMRGSFVEQLATRARTTIVLQTVVFLLIFAWRITAMILLGMALYRSGVITGERDRGWYRGLALVCLPLGFAVCAWGIFENFAHDWSFEYSMFYGAIPTYWGSLPLALGYIALVMLVVRSGAFPRVQDRLADVGRMAFTNYIAQSILCVLFFNVLGWYGSTLRWQQVLVMLAIWALQLWYSPLWLRRYRYGPLEWLWRSATYGHVPPLRR